MKTDSNHPPHHPGDPSLPPQPASPVDAGAHLTRGNTLYAGRQFSAALECYDQALQLDPLYPEAHNNRGGALHALGRFQEALDSFDQAVRLKPDYGEARRNRNSALHDFTQQQAALHPPRKTESSGRDLVFYCGPSAELWNPETARTKGIGGSEEAIIWLSRLLHQRGWNVTVYAHCGDQPQDYDGVSWQPFWLWNHRDRQDATVVWRYPHLTQYDINSAHIFIEMQDTFPESDFTPDRLQKISKIFVKSHFHRSLYPNIPDDKFIIVPNGIDASLFAVNTARDPLLLINTSSAGRSLEAFLDCFAQIKQQVPNARAQWAYGWDVWDSDPFMPAQRAQWKATMQARMQVLGVQELGRISHGDIARLYLSAAIFAYPSEYAEIDCISISKAMAAGAIPITTDFAAMGEKSGHGGIFIPSQKNKDNWIQPDQFHFEITDPAQKAQFVAAAVDLLRNPPSEADREPMRQWARSTFDWNKIVDVWHAALAAPSPANLDRLLHQARTHHAAGQFPEAEALYCDFLESSPEHPIALLLLGILLFQTGRYPLALDFLDRAIQADPASAEAHFARGNTLYALQRYMVSVDSYDQAIHLNPLHAEALNNRGSALLALGQFQPALESCDRALQLQPEYVDACTNRGHALYAMRQFHAALESYDRALQLQPNSAEAHNHRGNALHAIQHYLPALESYERAIELNPSYAEAHNNRGSALHALEQYRAALASYDQALRLQPNSADALANRENTLQALRQYLLFRPDVDLDNEAELFAAARRQVARIAQIENKPQMRAALDALPLVLRSHPAISNLRNLNFIKTAATGRDLVFYCSPPNETWNPETARTQGVGGSEEAVIWLSKLLRQRGWNVTVYGNCGTEPRDFDGVLWKPYWMWNPRDRQNITVIWRYPQYAAYDINSDAVVIDLHDAVPEPEFTPAILDRTRRIFAKSRFHRSLYPNLPDDRFVIVPNGIDADLFTAASPRDPLLLINTSSADRSLEAFLDCFAEIKRQVPNARAQWAYGWGVWDFHQYSDQRRMEWKSQMQARMAGLGVEELGRISHSEVARLYLTAGIFAYPSEYVEIDCISLTKAMAAGAIPITTDFAAMGEKAGHGGVFLHSHKTREAWLLPNQFHFEMTDPAQKAQFVAAAVDLLRNPPSEADREPMRQWARSTFDWNKIADRWHDACTALLRFPASAGEIEGRNA